MFCGHIWLSTKSRKCGIPNVPVVMANPKVETFKKKQPTLCLFFLAHWLINYCILHYVNVEHLNPSFSFQFSLQLRDFSSFVQFESSHLLSPLNCSCLYWTFLKFSRSIIKPRFMIHIMKVESGQPIQAQGDSNWKALNPGRVQWRVWETISTCSSMSPVTIQYVQCTVGSQSAYL